jgi:hypothetical protein
MDSTDFLKAKDKIASKLKLDSDDKIDDAFHYCRQLYLAEESHRHKIENRANLLIGTAAITAALLTAFLCMALYAKSGISLLFVIIILASYCSIVYFLIKTIRYAVNISQLEKFNIDNPDHPDVYSSKDSGFMYVKKYGAVYYYFLFLGNRDININKKRRLAIAQTNMRNAVIALLLILVIFLFHITLSEKIYIKHLKQLQEWLWLK